MTKLKDFETFAELQNIQHLTKRMQQKMWHSFLAREYKQSKGCLICGSQFKLELHHKQHRRNQRNVSDLINYGITDENLNKEFEKCQVLCKSCHKRIHGRAQHFQNSDSLNTDNEVLINYLQNEALINQQIQQMEEKLEDLKLLIQNELEKGCAVKVEKMKYEYKR